MAEGIDASIALNANRPVAQPYNALTAMGQSAQTANAMLHNRLIQTQLGQQQALGQAWQGVGVDASGVPDMGALIHNLQQTPAGSLAIPQVMSGILAQRKAQLELAALQQTQTTSRLGAINAALNPLMAMGANTTPDAIMRTVAGLGASGLPVDEIVRDMQTTLPSRQPGQDDLSYGASLHNWVVQHAARSWSPDVQAGKFTPTPNTTDAGGQIITRDTNPLTNPGITAAAPITRTMNPAEQTDQVKGPPGAGGAPTVIPRSTYAGQNGMGNLVPGGGSAFANGGRLPPALLNPNRPAGAPAPSAPPPAGGGGYAAPLPAAAPNPAYATPPAPNGTPAPGYAPPPAAGGPAPAPAAMQQPGTPMAVGLPPAQQAGLDAAGKASADQWASQQNLVAGSAARMYQLHAALGALTAPGTTTGPSAGAINAAKSYMLSLPVIGQNLGIDPNSVANYDLAQKYLTAYASARAGARGGTTDSQLATTLSSNASTHISNLAAVDVVKANLGLERMDQAQIQAFQQGLDPTTGQPTGQHLTPDAYSDYASRWNTSMDPRAFIADHLTPAQFATTVGGMQPQERAKFQSSFNAALSNGWIDAPAWMSPPTAATPAAGTPPAQPSASAPPAAVPAAPAAPDPSLAVPIALPSMAVDGNGQPAIRGY